MGRRMLERIGIMGFGEPSERWEKALWGDAGKELGAVEGRPPGGGPVLADIPPAGVGDDHPDQSLRE